MPFYEYQCSRCGHHHEELQRVGDPMLRKCPACGRSTLRRLVSAPVFRLKGGGWYETDFKSDKDRQRNLAGEKEPPAGKPAEAKPDAKADAKPEAKSEAKPEAKSADQPAAARSKPPSAKPATVRRRVPRRRR